MLLAIALGFLLGGPTGAAICFILAAMIALVLWTPLRRWLGIAPSRGATGYQPIRAPATSPEPTQSSVGIDLEDVIADISDNHIQGFDTGIRGRQSSLRTKGNKIDR